MSAETPSFWVANIQQVVNQPSAECGSDSKMVPAVSDVRLPQPKYQKRPSPSSSLPRRRNPGRRIQ